MTRSVRHAALAAVVVAGSLGAGVIAAGSSVNACGKSSFDHGAVIQTNCTSAG